MYNPLARIFQAVGDSGPSRPPPPADAPMPSDDPQPERTSRRRRVAVSRKKKTVLLRVVTAETARADAGLPRTASVREVCAAFDAMTRSVVSVHGAASEDDARALSATFGSGNMLIVALHNAGDLEPQYLAVGVTNGCEVDGRELRGRWDVLTALGGAANDFTRLALENSFHKTVYSNKHDDLFRWSLTPRNRPLTALLQNPCFAKPVMAKVWPTYALIRRARAEGREHEYTATTRTALLVELLVSFSEASKRTFLQLAGVPPVR
jgi:hypothetical protein